MPLPSAQDFVDAAELHSFVDLPAAFYGPLLINRPVLVNAQGSTFWSDSKTPSVRITCQGAGLINAILRKTPTKTGSALSIAAQCQPTLQNVKIEGGVSGHEHLGEWRLPGGVELLDVPPHSAEFLLRFQAGSPARIATRVAGIDFEPRTTDTGQTQARVFLQDLNPVSILTGDIELITGELTHLIPFSIRVGSVTRFSNANSTSEKEHRGNPATEETSPVTEPLNPALQLIPGGEFMMGHHKEVESPLRRVTLSAFYMEDAPVTYNEWHEVKEWALNKGYEFESEEAAYGTDHPIWQVSWYDALKWCNAKSQKLGLIPCYYTDREWSESSLYKTGELDLEEAMVHWGANGYRLPTEAEWEKAARGGLERQKYPLGNKLTQHDARFRQSDTVPVRSYPENGFGLFDMAGNIGEWCWDWYDPEMRGSRVNPRGRGIGKRRVIRGGTFTDYAADCRVFSRAAAEPGKPHLVGLRVVSSVNTRVTKVELPGRSDMALESDKRGQFSESTEPSEPAPQIEHQGSEVDSVQFKKIASAVGALHSGHSKDPSFQITQHPVSIQEWQRVSCWALQHGYEFSFVPSPPDADTVIQAPWFDTLKWCNARSEMEGRSPIYQHQKRIGERDVIREQRICEVSEVIVDGSADGFRLPTEEEWERSEDSGLLDFVSLWEWCWDTPIDGSKRIVRAVFESKACDSRVLGRASASSEESEARAFRLLQNFPVLDAGKSETTTTDVEPLSMSDQTDSAVPADPKEAMTIIAESLHPTLEQLVVPISSPHGGEDGQIDSEASLSKELGRVGEQTPLESRIDEDASMRRHANFKRHAATTSESVEMSLLEEPPRLVASPPTYAEWVRVRNWSLARGYCFEHLGSADSAAEPVVEVGWRDFLKWCNAKSELEGHRPVYVTVDNVGAAHVFSRGRISFAQLHSDPSSGGYRLDPPLHHLEGHWCANITCASD